MLLFFFELTFQTQKKKINQTPQSFLEVWFICSTFFVAPKKWLHGHSKISGLGCFKTCSKRTAFPTQHLASGILP